MLHMELNMMYCQWCLWSLHTLDIPEFYSRFDEYLAIEVDDECDSLVYDSIRFFFICLWGANFLHSLMAPEYWEALE